MEIFFYFTLLYFIDRLQNWSDFFSSYYHSAVSFKTFIKPVWSAVSNLTLGSHRTGSPALVYRFCRIWMWIKHESFYYPLGPIIWIKLFADSKPVHVPTYFFPATQKRRQSVERIMSLVESYDISIDPMFMSIILKDTIYNHCDKSMFCLQQNPGKENTGRLPYWRSIFSCLHGQNTRKRK